MQRTVILPHKRFLCSVCLIKSTWNDLQWDRRRQKISRVMPLQTDLTPLRRSTSTQVDPTRRSSCTVLCCTAVYCTILYCVVYSVVCMSGVRPRRQQTVHRRRRGRCKLAMFLTSSLLLVSSLAFSFPLCLKQLTAPVTGMQTLLSLRYSMSCIYATLLLIRRWRQLSSPRRFQQLRGTCPPVLSGGCAPDDNYRTKRLDRPHVRQNIHVPYRVCNNHAPSPAACRYLARTFIFYNT